MTEINILDLFCGCGGNMSGCDRALKALGISYRGLAINHWKVAVDTMRANFPGVTTLDCKIEEAIPYDTAMKYLKGKTIHLGWASPTCTHFSRAIGGRPRSNQLRSQPEFVITWCSQCDVRTLIVENVPEFVEWGPLDEEEKPIKEKKGETFKAWVKMLESLGYDVKWDVLNCADYGDATTRKRFFLMATKDGVPPAFPEPTHCKSGVGLKKWKSSGECIDFSNRGKSIFGRPRPLSPKTLARLADGARRYWGIDIEAGDLVKLSDPKRKLEPFIVKLRNHETVDSINNPLSTITCGGRHHALVQPFIVNNFEHNVPKPVDDPMPALTTGNHVMVVTPSLVFDHQNHGKAEPPDRPMKTISTHEHFLLVSLVLGQHGAAACRPASEPCPTVACKGAVRVISPIVVDNANGGTVRSADEPLNTVTIKDNHMLYLPVLEDGRRLDILMRMLTPRELARAHSLPDDFVLTGNKTEQTKQVGNSVPAKTAEALCRAMLRRFVA